MQNVDIFKRLLPDASSFRLSYWERPLKVPQMMAEREASLLLAGLRNDHSRMAFSLRW
jgi:hypothetical protein